MTIKWDIMAHTYSPRIEELGQEDHYEAEASQGYTVNSKPTLTTV